jgi:hypothetical protein
MNCEGSRTRGTGSSNPSPSCIESVSLAHPHSRVENPGFRRGCALASFEVIKAWGFRYSGIRFVWVKLNKGEPAFWMAERDFFTGMGYTTRKNAELCLLARRGSPKRLRRDIHELIIAPRREH